MLKTRADGYPNLTIRLDALILYLGDPLLRFDSILDNNVPELDKTVTTSKKGGQDLCGVVYLWSISYEGYEPLKALIPNKRV